MNRFRPRIAPRFIPLLATAVVLLTLYGSGCLRYRNFGSARVLVNLLGDNAFLGVAAIGATFVILSGGIDLSVGAVIAFTSTLVASLIEHHGAPPLAAIALGLAIGTAFGALMGALIHNFQLPPFLVTLAGLFFARSMAFVLEPKSLSLKDPFFTATGCSGPPWSPAVAPSPPGRAAGGSARRSPSSRSPPWTPRSRPRCPRPSPPCRRRGRRLPAGTSRRGSERDGRRVGLAGRARRPRRPDPGARDCGAPPRLVACSAWTPPTCWPCAPTSAPRCCCWGCAGTGDPTAAPRRSAWPSRCPA